MKVKDVIGPIISHNERVSINIVDPEDDHYKLQIFQDMGHQIPKELLNRKFVRIFGCVTESLWDSDIIHILVE